MVEKLIFCAFIRASVLWGFVASCSMRRREDVNVNTVSQCKGMCEARRKKNQKPWGQSPKDEGRGEERKEGRRGGGKMKQRTRELAERKPGEEESRKDGTLREGENKSGRGNRFRGAKRRL